MRVISGLWRGRRLEAPRGKSVRPTTDRVKEAMFNILERHVRGARVLDLCCGTGSLGIEALSRGAAEAVFVDTARVSLEATQRNLDRCKVDEATFTLVTADAIAFLEREWQRTASRPLVLLCDPPYDADLALRLLQLKEMGAPHDWLSAAAVELPVGGVTPDSLRAPWELRRYGRTLLAVMRRNMSGDDHG